ncbi:hypothetical protein D9M72_385590 [compost metagenome]
MATAPRHADGDGVGGRHERAGQEAELAGRMPRHVVQREHRIAREQPEQAVLDHLARAAHAFLGRLEDNVQRAPEGLVRGQVARRGQQHGSVAVMAAGVHLAVDLAGIRQAGGFTDRQRIHVGAQADGGAVAVAQRADHAGAAQATVHGITPCLQALCHQVAGGEFLEAQLGMGMDAVAQVHHLGFDGADAGQDGIWMHGVSGGLVGGIAWGDLMQGPRVPIAAILLS